MADPASPASHRPHAEGHGPRYRWDPARGRMFKIVRLREDLEGNVAELAIEVPSATGEELARARGDQARFLCV